MSRPPTQTVVSLLVIVTASVACGPSAPMDATGDGDTGGSTTTTGTVASEGEPDGPAGGPNEPFPTTEPAPTCYDDSECADGEECVFGQCVDASGTLSPCPDIPVASSTWLLGAAPSSLILLDVDGDGDLDIVAAEYQAGRLELALNDGAGNFAPGPVIVLAGGSSGLDVLAGDLDGDAIPELVVASYEPDVLFVLRGQGGMYEPIFQLLLDSGLAGLAIARVDGDPFPDFVGFDVDGEFVVVLRGDGKGGLLAALPAPAVRTTYGGAAVDLDDDGLADILGTPPEENDVAIVARAAGDGGFVVEAPLPDSAFGVSAVFGVDLDGGSLLDVVGTGVTATGGAVYVWNASSPTSWSAPQSFATTQPLFGAAAVDFDGDGAVDVVSSSLYETIVVTLGDGAGGFRCRQEYVVPTAFIAAIAVGDVDGDGRKDIVIGALIDGAVTVLRRQ